MNVELCVIIPCHNEEATLGQQLDALATQEWDGTWEVVVVDNRSTDRTAELARAHLGLRDRLRVITANDFANIAYARRCGVEASNARSVVFCDGDDVVAPGWVAAMADALRRENLVTGDVEVLMLNEAGLAASRGRSRMGVVPRFGNRPILRGNCGGMTREIWDQFGGFDETFAGLEDIEFSLRVAAAGHTVIFVPEAIVHYRYRNRLRNLWLQGLYYGKSYSLLKDRCRMLGIAGPSRLSSAKSWAWVVLYVPLAVSKKYRSRWIWTLAVRLGSVLGAIRVRTRAASIRRERTSSIIFACGTPYGGALDSTLTVARFGRDSGFRVDVVVADQDPYRTRPRLTGALVKVARTSKKLGSVAWRIYDRAFSRTSQGVANGVDVRRTSDVAAAITRIAVRGDLIVVNSVRKIDLQRITAHARQAGCRVAWYLREPSSLAFVATDGHLPDVLIANSRPLADEAARLSGRHCGYVPSAIEREGLAEPLQRSTLLLVNPLPQFGLQEALTLARHLPEQHVVLQESWPLEGDQVAELQQLISSLPNVEFRRKVSRTELFVDTRAILAPYAPGKNGESRPRVMLEAQLMGIPMVGHTVPGISSVAASKDLLVTVGATGQEWANRIAKLNSHYEQYSADARVFADSEMPIGQRLWQELLRECGAVPEADQ